MTSESDVQTHNANSSVAPLPTWPAWRIVAGFTIVVSIITVPLTVATFVLTGQAALELSPRFAAAVIYGVAPALLFALYKLERVKRGPGL